MYCLYCGFEYEKSFKICPKCGNDNHSEKSKTGLVEAINRFSLKFPFFHVIALVIFSFIIGALIDEVYYRQAIELRFRQIGYNLADSQKLSNYTAKLANAGSEISISFLMILIYSIICSYKSTSLCGRLGVCVGGLISSYLIWLIPAVIFSNSLTFFYYSYFLILYCMGYLFNVKNS